MIYSMMCALYIPRICYKGCNDKFFKANIGRILHNPLYGRPLTIPTNWNVKDFIISLFF